MALCLHRKVRIAGLILVFPLLVFLSGPTPSHAKPVEGFGKLKFGMKPKEVEALEGCSSSTECLYEILGKNRYFILKYGANGLTGNEVSSPPPTANLSQIDIDMGNHTKEWFLELYDVLARQYPVSHIPGEQEDANFRDGTNNELIIGFADDTVLLKLVRRPFGNLILRVIYQDQAAAQTLRQHWEPPPIPPTSQ